MASSWSAPNRLDQEPGATQSVLPKMTVERARHLHLATVKPLNRGKGRFLGLRSFRGGPFYAARTPPVWSAWAEGRHDRRGVFVCGQQLNAPATPTAEGNALAG